MDVEAVADVPDGADERLEVAELGAEASHVHVDRAGAAEVVVAPDLAEELLAGEHPRRVRGEEAEELELLEGQVERASAHLRRVAGLVDDDARRLDLRARRVLGGATRGQADPRVDLGRTRGLEHDVLDVPLAVHGGQAALRDDEDDRRRRPARREDLAEGLRADQVGAGVHEHQVALRRVDQLRGLGGDVTDPVAQQTETRQDVAGRG
ncbi:hypothetical protein Cus16_2899 [Curtobacterium sp. ER1/6]|nr:hypothetical protein Cus16_2899 [Curtobacterium sp. ER1/6]